MTSLVKASIDASLFIQIVTLLLNLFAFFIPVDRWDFALKEILGLETAVQIVELVFYSWYRGKLVGNGFDVTQFRYYDWFVTTPTMLFSTASYYGYLDRREEDGKEPFSVVTFWKENSNWILLMFLCNALMLWFGYLQEIGILSIVWSSILGYVSLLGSFGILYKQFVSKTPQQQGLFYFMFSVWSLYGIAAMLQNKEKNIFYNVLDIFAKNFYGLFLGYLLVQRKI
jgi:bacteriorhodopsin